MILDHREASTTKADHIRRAAEALGAAATIGTVQAQLAQDGIRAGRSHIGSVLADLRRNGQARPDSGPSLNGQSPDTGQHVLRQEPGGKNVSPGTGRQPDVTPHAEDPAPVSSRRSVDPAVGYYAVAALSLAVSADTSWRYFGERLGITGTVERAALFLVLESALVACAYGMSAAVRRTGSPGTARLVVYLLLAASAWMSYTLAGPVAGTTRILLGPLLSAVMVHLALGVERRNRTGQPRTSDRVRHEMTERLLSRLGLSDDDRTALERTRARAAVRVAHLVHARAVVFRRARLRRAVRASHAAHDPRLRGVLLAELAAAQHLHQLRALDLTSPWGITHTVESPTAGGPGEPGWR